MSGIIKSREITDAQISFVSLVDKAANKRQFLITKAEDATELAEWSTTGRIVKTDDDNHYVTGIVYEPLTEDAHGDFMSEDEVTKAAYWFAKNGNGSDLQHSFTAESGVTVVENWIAKSDFKIGNESIKKGTWLITTEITDEAIWEKIKKGEITGYSMGGKGKYSEEDVDLDKLSKSDEKVGILKRLASLLGVGTVEKGEVKEKYDSITRSASFWNAFNALEDTLYSYNWKSDSYEYENDSSKIKEALSDFSEIITSVLTADNAVKSINPFESVSKAGKTMSAKNKATLESIYESLGEFIKGCNPEEEQEEKMTKAEVKALVDESVAKALGKSEDMSEEATPDFIAETVNKAVAKALGNTQQETQDHTADISKMVNEAVEAAVAKAIEPIKQQTGYPANLNGDIQKQETKHHYLHGIL